jgi:hypothetical protein
MEMIKIQWTWYDPEDATWESEDAMQVEYPHLFKYFSNVYVHVYMMHQGQCINKRGGCNIPNMNPI